MEAHSVIKQGFSVCFRCFVSLLMSALLFACDVESVPVNALQEDKHSEVVEFTDSSEKSEIECRDIKREGVPGILQEPTGEAEINCDDTNSFEALSLLPVAKIGAKNYQYGDKIELLLSSAEDIYAYCYFQAADESIYQIFPNVHQSHNRLAAGELTEIPGDSRVALVADSAKGAEKVVCFGHKEVVGDYLSDKLSVMTLEKLNYQSLGDVLREHQSINQRLAVSRVFVVARDTLSKEYVTRWESIEPVVVSVQANTAVGQSMAMQSGWVLAGTFKSMLRSILIFLHLLIFACAISLVAWSDYSILRTGVDESKFQKVANAIVVLLCLLWLSGLVIIFLDTQFNVHLLAEKPKLVLKLVCVTVLTVNGIYLHKVCFKELTSNSFMSRTIAKRLSVGGSLSTSNWFLAAYIGSAGFLNGYSISFLLTLYALLLCLFVLVGLSAAPIIQRRMNMLRDYPEPQHSEPSMGSLL